MPSIKRQGISQGNITMGLFPVELLAFNCLLAFSLVSLVDAAIRVPLKRAPRSFYGEISELNGEQVNFRRFQRGGIHDYVQNLTNSMNFFYYGDVGLGTPPQNFRVVFDTGSSDFWVLSNTCSWLSVSCWVHNRYKSEKSSTFESDGNRFEIRYLKGRVSGFLSRDTLTMAGVGIPRQTFGEASIPRDLSFALAPYDGVLGLGFPSLADSHAPPLFNMYQQGTIDQLLFSVQMTRNQETDHGGAIFFGSIPFELINNETLRYVDLLGTGFWEFHFERVSLFNGTDLCQNEFCEAIADTGTTFIFGPTDQVDAIHRNLGGVSFDMTTMLECSTVAILPSVTFTIRGRDYVLTPQDYTFRAEIFGQKACFSGFVGRDLPTRRGKRWILGDVFLRKFLSVYDAGNKRMGFAEYKD